MRPKAVRDVAVRVGEVGSRLAPAGRVDARRTVGQLSGNGRGPPGPEPDFDGRARELHSVVSATIGVESGTEAVRVGRLDATSSVAVVVGIAVSSDSCAEHGCQIRFLE